MLEGIENSNEQHVLEEDLQEVSPLDLNPKKLLFIIKKTIAWMIFLPLLGVLGSFLYLRYTPSVYQASTIIKLNFKSNQSLLNLDVGGFNEGIDAINLAGEMELLKSSLIFQGVIDSLDLDVSFFSKGDVLNTEIYGEKPFKLTYEVKNLAIYDLPIFISPQDEKSFLFRYENVNFKYEQVYFYGEEILTPDFELVIEKIRDFNDYENEYFFILNSHHSLRSYMASKLNVEIENRIANTLKITFNEFNRAKAVDILEAINRNYIRLTVENKNRTYIQTISYLRAQLKQSSDSIDYIKTKLRRYPELELLLQDEFTFTDIFSQIKTIEDVKLEYSLEKRGYIELKHAIKSDSSFTYLVALSSLVGDGVLSEYIGKLAQVDTDLIRVDGYYKKSTYSYKRSKDDNKRIRAQLLVILELKEKAISEKIAQVNEKLAQLNISLTGDDNTDPEFKRLKGMLDIYKEVNNSFVSKLIELNVAKAGTVPDFQILALPSALAPPISPKPMMVYIIGGGIGVVLVLLLIVLRYLLLNKVSSIDEIEKAVSAPVIGLIPDYLHANLEYSQLVVHKKLKSSISESMRATRTNLDFMSQGDGTKIISITSTISGEGKTFVALNLAGIISLSEKKVIILDLDLRKPKIHLGLNSENHVGLSTLLIGKNSLEECIRTTEIDNLNFITAGPIPPNPSELIMSKAFNDLLDELKKEYDTIILDTPPVGLVTDGIIAMRQASVKLYVVRANYSELGFLNNINKLKKVHKFKNLAVIMNSVSNKTTYGYGQYSNSYSYSYGPVYENNNYGYYADDVPEKKTLKSKIFSKFKKGN